MSFSRNTEEPEARLSEFVSAKARLASCDEKNQPLIVAASVLILVLMALPNVVKATTAAIATKAAATAYSESSRPVSSRKKFLIMICSLGIFLG
jgi:hypothetical protein